MVFLYRAAIVSLVTFASALAGFGLQSLLPDAYVAASKGMIGSVVGLDATLLALMAVINLLTTVTAALGALSIGSAAFLILELSDPYVGLFKIPVTGFDGLMRTLALGEANEAARAEP